MADIKTHRIARVGRRVRARLRGDQGFTLIEVLIAAIIMLVGIVATIGAFGSSKHTTLVAQRTEVAIHQAQKELERMRALKYDALGLNTDSAPAQSSDPSDPRYRIQPGGLLRIKPGPPPHDEELVLLGSEPGGKVDPGPTNYTIGEGGGAVTGKIYRYVTWRDEPCPAGICDGSQNTKRLVVAITVDRGNIGPRNPIWVSTIVANPNESVAGEVDPSPPPPGTSAQNFYLYDKRCDPVDSNNGYSAPTTGHATHDTASAGATCEIADAARRPSLMGPVTPDYDNPPLPPFKYSSDLTGDYPAGLAMIRSGTACPATSYPAADTTGKWRMHAWATRKFSADFSVTGTAFVNLWTTSVGSLSGTGRICVTLVDRLYSSGTTDDVVLGSATYETSPWPTTKSEPGKSCGTPDFSCAAQRTFSFALSGSKVRANARLMLIVTVLGSSDKDLVFLYDDPRYRSFVEVETSTPCDDSGTPCSTS